MNIRCERCSTLYELDESLLAAEGSEVQCARCQHVFVARPASAPGQTLVGVPAAERPQPAPAPAPQAAHPVAPPPPAPAQPPRPTAAPPAAAPAHSRPATGGAVYRPPVSQPTVSRPPLLRRDTVGTFESRLRWSHRWKWLAPMLFLAAVGGAVVVFLLRESVVDPRARAAQQAALATAYRDDLSSLEQARSQLDDAIRAAPRLHAAAADRALVELLMASALIDQAADSGAKREARVDGLVAEATRALDELEKSRLAPAEVARARAVAAAMGTDRAQAKRLATAARGHVGDDPLVQAAEQSVEIRSGDRATRERAIAALSVLVSRRPEVMRARWLLARGQALAGRRSEAVGTLDVLLKANPRHAGARALREALARPAAAPSPAAAASAPPPPAPAARVEKPAAQPRKPDSSAGEPPDGASAGGAAGAASARKPAPEPAAAVQDPAPAAPAATGPGPDRPAGEADAAPVAPRLRPAAVPEPEPVQPSGG